MAHAYPINGYIAQAPFHRTYPKRVDACAIPGWHDADMEPPPPAFDRERVRAEMKARKVSQTDMAKLVGLTSQSAMANILAGTRKVTADEAAIIYRFLGLPMVALPPEVQHVPVIGFASAGAWRDAVQMPIGSMSVPPKRAGPRAFAVEIQGDSLDLIVQPGGYLVIDPDQKELRPGKFYLIQNGEHETTVKCYQRDPARFEPASKSDLHAAISASDVEVIIGRVCWKADPM